MIGFSIGETIIAPSEFAIIDRIAHSFSQLGGFIEPYLGDILLSAWNGTVMFLCVGSLALLSIRSTRLSGGGYPASPTEPKTSGRR